MNAAEKKKTRREFLRDAAVFGGALASLSSIPYRASAQVVGANDRIRIGIMGAGGRARQHMSFLLPGRDEGRMGVPQWKVMYVPGAEIVAIADVYEPNRDHAAAIAGTGDEKVPRLPGTPGPEGYRCRHHRLARPLAQADAGGRGGGGQRCVCGEIRDPRGRRRPRGNPSRREERPHGADRDPDAELAPLHTRESRLLIRGRWGRCGSSMPGGF